MGTTGMKRLRRLWTGDIKGCIPTLERGNEKEGRWSVGTRRLLIGSVPGAFVEERHGRDKACLVSTVPGLAGGSTSKKLIYNALEL